MTSRRIPVVLPSSYLPSTDSPSCRTVLSSGDTCVFPGNDYISICPAEAGEDATHNLMRYPLQPNCSNSDPSPGPTALSSGDTYLISICDDNEDISGDSYGFSGNHRTSICPAEADEDASHNLTHRTLQMHQSTNRSTTIGSCDNNCIDNVIGLRTSFEDSSHPLKIYYQNTRGLRTKTEEFFLSVSEMDYDVIVLTETWLNDQHLSTQLFGNSYAVYRDDRNSVVTGLSRGGGVLIAVANYLSSSLVQVRTVAELDQIWVKTELNECNVYIGVVYFSPDQATTTATIEDHLDSVRAISEATCASDINILFGDYNQPNLVWTESPSGFAYANPVDSRFTAACSSNLRWHGRIGS